MAKVLGLDLGTNSLGWSVVDDCNNEILGMGSRVFPEGVIAKTIGTGDKEISKNAGRSESKQIRKQYYRKRLRKVKLLRLLIDLNMCPLTHSELDTWVKWDKKKGSAGRVAPNSDLYKRWHKQNPYILRDRGIYAALTLMEFGRVLYHIIQRRGFLSSRKGSEDGKIYKGKDNISGIEDTKEAMKKETLGSFLQSILPKEGEPFKEVVDENNNVLRVRARYTLRSMYVEEFFAIWNKQAHHLGLDSIIRENEKTNFFKGSLESKRNKAKIEKLREKYGLENVTVLELNNTEEGGILNKVITKKKESLKTFLAGEINEDDEGLITFKSKESVLFWQRPLGSQKGLLSKCRFEPTVKNKKGQYIQKGKTPCLLSHPLFEEFRAYQFINTIRFDGKTKLNKYQRELVLELINSKDKSFNFLEIVKKLNLEFHKWNYKDTYKVTGNYTIKHLKALFKDRVWYAEKKRQTDNGEFDVEYGYEQIWNCFHFYEDTENLEAKLIKDFGLSEKDRSKISKIKIKEGYSNVSLKAIRNILPYLKEGKDMSDATLLGGVKNTFGNRWERFEDWHQEINSKVLEINHQRDNKEGEAIQKIKNYLIENDFGFVENDSSFIKLYHHSQSIEKKEILEKLEPIENLRNPIVQQSLSETKRLVNELIEKYGKFDRINIELGRDIKNSKKGRQELSRIINDNTKKNDEARTMLTGYGLKHSRDNIQKVLLYKEMENRGFTVCPYTNRTMNIGDVLGSENKIQIEHIFPKSISLNDSFSNKTLCDAKFNGLKGNLTPYQFYLKNSSPQLWGGANTWEQIERRAYKLLPYNKAKHFTSKVKIEETEVKSSFIERQLNDTRYISKKTKEIMSQICADVRVSPGRLTAELRHLWGLNNILQPIMLVDLPTYKVNGDKSEPHYVVLNEDNKPVSVVSVNRKKPVLNKNETTLLGKVVKGKFIATSKGIEFEKEAKELKDGDYWLKLKLSKVQEVVKVFKEIPKPLENEIVLKGRVEKGNFKRDGLSFIKTNGLENGSYWARFRIVNTELLTTDKNKLPKRKKGQLFFFGEVNDGRFKSYLYEFTTEKKDGKYWALLELDIDNATFEKAINEKPKSDSGKIIIEGTVNSKGLFVSDLDAEHQFKTSQLKRGKYWMAFNIVNTKNDFEAVENTMPILEKGETLAEGLIWVDKRTGEIKFDPKKNRNDHRHHAIDALVVALSKQAYVQRLSKYNEQKEAKKKGLPYDKNLLTFDMPWDGFHSAVKKEVQKLLVSHKQNRKVLTIVSKKIYKNGIKHTSKGDAVRGQLHETSFYGERQAPLKTTKGYHIRKSVSSLTDKQVDKIVDDNIKKIIKEAKTKEVELKKEMTALEKLKKKARTDLDDSILNEKINKIRNEINQLYTLKNKNGARVPIKKVRIREEISNARPLNNNTQFVNPKNNHHVVIYKDNRNELKEIIVSFWDAVKRKKEGKPEIQLPEADENATILAVLQRDDMFLLGLSNKEYENNKNNPTFLTTYLYRVQKISKGDYSFRHHLASTLDNEKQLVRVTSIKKWIELNPIKVRVDNMGSIF